MMSESEAFIERALKQKQHRRELEARIESTPAGLEWLRRVQHIGKDDSDSSAYLGRSGKDRRDQD